MTENTKIEWLNKFDGTDLEDLCEATEDAILDGNGFGWLKPPPRDTLESFWKGVLLIPGRSLVVARFDGTIVGSGQLAEPSSNNEAQSFSASITTFFVAPYARGHGLARGLLREIENRAIKLGFDVIELNVRETQLAAIALYESCDYERWATKSRYAMVDENIVAGHFYLKDLRKDFEEV